jgi:hypothetical protein
MWTCQWVVRPPRPHGLAWGGLRVTACWRQAGHRLACDACHNIDIDTIDPPDYPHANSR